MKMLMVSIAFILFLSACSSNQTNESQSPDPNESEETNNQGGQGSQNENEGEAAGGGSQDFDSVTLTVLTPIGTNHEIFMERYGHLIQEKYPQFSYEVIPATKENLESITIDKIKVDLVMSSFNVLRGQIQPLNYLTDMTDLIEAHEFDLDRVEPSYIEMIQNLDNGSLSALPFFDQRVVMFYNEDLFDSFGVSYPTDGMTWDETAELAKQMTREADSIQYYGFAASPTLLVTINQQSLDYVDIETNKAIINTDAWQKYIQNFVPLYTMAGYEPDPEKLSPVGVGELFFQEKVVAMHPSFNADNPKEDQNINWDAVTLPEFKDLPGVGSQPYPVYLAVTSVSENRDEAFAALAQLLSNEAQSWLTAEMGFPTVLKDEEVKAQFAKKLPAWEGKNIHAIGAQSPSSPPNNVKFISAYAQQEVDLAMTEVITGEKDVVTALRDAAERANSNIDTYLAQ